MNGTTGRSKLSISDLWPLAMLLTPLCLLLLSVASGLTGISFGVLAELSTGAIGIVFVAVSTVWIGVRLVNRQKRCAHGVRAGTRGRCRTCNRDAELLRAETQRQHEVELYEYERRKQISSEAKQVRDQEIKRLSQGWVSLAESYFDMTPQQFETAIAEVFRRLGYKVEQTPFTNDGGKDAIALKDGKKFLIECKRYGETNSIGRRDIQIFVAAIQDEKADSGFYINTGVFTKNAREYAKRNGIALYDRSRFPLLVHEAYPQSVNVSTANVMCIECGAVVPLPLDYWPTTGNCPNGHLVTSNVTKGDFRVLESDEIPIPKCDRCGSPMRIVGKGRRAFWGCSRYPRCRSTKRANRSRVS